MFFYSRYQFIGFFTQRIHFHINKYKKKKHSDNADYEKKYQHASISLRNSGKLIFVT